MVCVCVGVCVCVYLECWQAVVIGEFLHLVISEMFRPQAQTELFDWYAGHVVHHIIHLRGQREPGARVKGQLSKEHTHKHIQKFTNMTAIHTHRQSTLSHTTFLSLNNFSDINTHTHTYCLLPTV